MGNIDNDNTVDWADVRAKNARIALRKQVDVIRNGTPMADAPLVLHKSIYTSQKRFEAEQKHIFRNQPLVAGLSGDLPNNGDMLIFDAAGPSIIVSRGKDGIVRAFLNMCTHRGAKLIEETEPWKGKGFVQEGDDYRKTNTVCDTHVRLICTGNRDQNTH